MFRIWIQFLIVTCIAKLLSAHGTEALEHDLILTESFFQKLGNDYASILPDIDSTKQLDEKIAKFVETLQSPIHWRHRRHLVEHPTHTSNGIGVLGRFSAIFEDPFPNVSAICVFTHYNGIQLQWFIATLDDSRISLFLYNGNQFEKVGQYSVISGARLSADCSDFGCVLVMSKVDGSVTILRLFLKAQGYILRPVQYLRGLGDVRFSIWNGMNQMFLGISSSNNISIYHWLGEHFDSIQVLNYDAGKLTPFQIGGSIYLAVTGVRTTVLRFYLQQNAFILAQQLPPADDIESFYVGRGHRQEHYLVLSNQESTIIYKFVGDHFVPFQNIRKADHVSSITTEETVVLLALKDNLLKIYQYNGWKFVELSFTMPELDRIHPTTLDGELILIVKHTNGTWKFMRLIWIQQSTWDVLKAEIISWSLDVMRKAERQPLIINKLSEPVQIMHGHIGKLWATNLNGKNTEKLIYLSNRFKELQSNLAANEKLFSQVITKDNPRFTTLYASDVTGKCTLGCKIKNLNTAVKNDILGILARPNIPDQNLVFENVKARLTGNLPCPKPAVFLNNVIVNKHINGITFESLQDNLLRITGNQEVTEKHIYASLSTTSALIPLDIATQSTRQELHACSIKANNLYLMQGGILLPLNGQPVMINDTKTVSKVKITGPVHLRGKVQGNGVKNLKPVTWVNEPLQLWGNYSLQKVTINTQATAPDLILAKKQSLTHIVSQAIRLDETVPVHLKLSKVKTTWTNITADMTKNWVTASIGTSVFGNIKNITGTKRSPNNLTITNLSYETLPVSTFSSSLCASEATIDDIENWIVTVGQASAETLKTEYIAGASKLNDIIMDTATITLANNLTVSSKVFTGIVNVKNASLDAIDGIDFQRLLNSMVAWREPGTVKGTVNASNLAISHLLVSNGFVPPLITKAKKLISKGNIYFDTLNGIDISTLAQSIVKLDETLSSSNVAFADVLIANNIQTSIAPVDLSGTKNMGTKIIARSLKAANLVLPYSFTYPSGDARVNLMLEGSATFAWEPKVQNINLRNIEGLFEETWLIDQPSILYSKAFVIRHIVLEGDVQVLGWLNSKNHGPWNQTSERIFSRTKPQEINTRVYMKIVTAPNIISTKLLTLSAPESFLDGLGEYSMKKDGVQYLSTNMRFQKLIILGDLNTRSKINGKDLSTDIVRYDVKDNIVTGRKTVLTLRAENLNGGLNFAKWQTNTLKTSDMGKPVVVEGVKTFSNITILKPLRVDGLVKGRRMEDYLLKSSPQQISGVKKIDGTLIASEIVIDGLVNDVNLSSLVKHQLKKNKQAQVIKTHLVTKGDITIIGNVTINGLYHGVKLKDFHKLNTNLELVSDRMAELKQITKPIHTALSRKACYSNKLQLIGVNSTSWMPDPVKFNPVNFEGLGNCTSRNGKLTCDNQTVQHLIFTPNLSRVLFSQVFQLAGVPLIVLVTSDPNGGVWIYTYDNSDKKLYQIAGLNIPGAMQASANVTLGSLWLALQLTRDMIILRYDASGQFEEYTLAGSELFLMETAPTGELLLFRSDGVWRLGGLSGPRQLITARLSGNITTYVVENNHYIQLVRNEMVSLLKTCYIGN